MRTKERPEERPERALIYLMLKSGEEYPVTQSAAEHWRELYPDVDIMQELRRMSGWCEANAARRKTKSGIPRFITGWLAKEQSRNERLRRSGESARAPKNRFANFSQRQTDFDELRRLEDEYIRKLLGDELPE